MSVVSESVCPLNEDEQRLRLALLAAQDSGDPSTQVGAVIVNAVGERLGACNAPVIDRPGVDLWQSPYKGLYIEHAERAVIYRASRYDHGTSGATLYATWAACPDCARAIAAAGIVRVVTCEALMDATPARWRDAVSAGLDILHHAGVRHDTVRTRLGVTIRFDGKTVEV